MSKAPTSDRKKRTRAGSILSWLLPVVVLIVAVGAIVLVARALPSRDRSGPAGRREPLNVHTLRVDALETFPEVIVLNGTVEPYRVVTVAAEVAGRVETYAGREDPHLSGGQPRPETASARRLGEGDTVRAGQPLLYLNTDLLAAEVRMREADVEYSERDLDTVREALKRGVATEMELQQKKTQLDLARAQLALSRANLDRSNIHAPISGVLNRLLVEEGEYVQPGTPVAEIVEVDRVKVIIDVPEREIRSVEMGEHHRILDARAADGEPATGEITYVAKTADPATRTTRVELTVKNADGRYHAGQIVNVALKLRELDDVILVPLEAVIPLEQGYRVYVLEGGRAEPREIEIDINSVRGREVRVTDGLGAGELLIVSGQRLASPGQEVRVVEGPSGVSAPAPAKTPTAAPVDPDPTASARADAAPAAEEPRP